MSEARKPESWRWKVADPAANAKLKMLYEPGNWGDVLKGAWAIAAARAAIEAGRLKRLRYLDPFAGAPTYPLTAAAVQRMVGQTGTRLAALQAPFVRRGVLASTALLVREAAAAADVAAELAVFDLDPERLSAWEQVAEARVLAAPSGAEALEQALEQKTPPDLLLLDPYDFLAGWKELLPRVLRAAHRTVVVVYVYNRAPRSAGFWNEYRRFRKGLEAGLEGTAFLLGRIPSDAVLPRAYHEALLIGAPAILAHARAELAGVTRALARGLAETGAFEEGDVTRPES